jgi:hypothetical protein
VTVETRATVDLAEDTLAADAVKTGRTFDAVAREVGGQLEYLVNDVLIAFTDAERVKTSVVWSPTRES